MALLRLLEGTRVLLRVSANATADSAQRPPVAVAAGAGLPADAAAVTTRSKHVTSGEVA